MGDFYVPTIWAQRYKTLPAVVKTEVDDEANRLFKARTGVSRVLDPKKDHDLANRWLRIRDEVMSKMAGKGAPDWRKSGRGLALGQPNKAKNNAFLLLFNYDIEGHQMKPEHIKVLDGAIVPLLTLPGLDVMVGVLGFASRTGEDAANATLSEKRATEVDKYLRKKAPSGVIFFKSGGWGEKQQVSKNPEYREIWPLLESIDEDERDRSVGIQINWQPVGIIDDLNQPNIDWNKAFERAATRAGLMYALGAFIKVTADYAPSPKVKGVPSPWNPVTGWPNSWTNDRPDGWKVMDAMRPEIISDIELSVKRMGLKITRAQIEEHYEEWLKSPTNTWVPRTK